MSISREKVDYVINSTESIVQPPGKNNVFFFRPYANNRMNQLYFNKYKRAWSDGKESASNGGNPGLIPGSRRSPGEGNGNSLQNSSLENPRDRGAWQATIDGVADSDTTE